MIGTKSAASTLVSIVALIRDDVTGFVEFSTHVFSIAEVLSLVLSAAVTTAFLYWID